MIEEQEVELDFPTYILTTALEAFAEDTEVEIVKIEYDMRVVSELTHPHLENMGIKDLVLAWKMVMEKFGKPFLYKNTKLDVGKLQWVVWANPAIPGFGSLSELKKELNEEI